MTRRERALGNSKLRQRGLRGEKGRERERERERETEDERERKKKREREEERERVREREGGRGEPERVNLRRESPESRCAYNGTPETMLSGIEPSASILQRILRSR